MKNKKAASPIIAFFISAIFAIGLGVIVLNLNDYAVSQEDICLNSNSIRIALEETGPQICKFNVTADNQERIINLLYFTMENVAEVPIFGYHITMIGDSEDPIYIKRDYDIVVLPYRKLEKVYPIPDSIGNLVQVKIGIYRKLGEERVFCPESNIVTSNIPECKENVFEMINSD